MNAQTERLQIPGPAGLLQAGLLDELIVYMAPALLGDSARPLLALPLEHMAEKIPLLWDDVRKVGSDWRFTVIPQAASSVPDTHQG